MSTLRKLALAAALGLGVAALPLTAAAHGGDRGWDRHDRWEHRWDDRGHRDHWKHRHHERRIIRERVIVERPRYYEQRIYSEPYPAYGYGYSYGPAVTISVPPIVIPIR